MFAKFAAIAISTALVAAPAAATTAPASAQPAAKSATAPAAKERRYCMQYEAVTGSRTSAKTECRTRADWARRGIDVGSAG